MNNPIAGGASSPPLRAATPGQLPGTPPVGELALPHYTLLEPHMDTTSLTIPAETARHVLWRYDRTGGAEPGPFTKHLMAAISHADHRNRAILREAYPELSEALHLAHSDEDGLSKLQAIAAGQVTA